MDRDVVPSGSRARVATASCASCGSWVQVHDLAAIAVDARERGRRLHRRVREVRHDVLGLDARAAAGERGVGVADAAHDLAGRAHRREQLLGVARRVVVAVGARLPRDRRAPRGRAARPTCDRRSPRRRRAAATPTGGLGAGSSRSARTPGTALARASSTLVDLAEHRRRARDHRDQHARAAGRRRRTPPCR